MSGRILSAHAVEIVPPDAYRETEWHEARRSGIGASEIAAVLGISPWVSAFDLWWSKRSGVDSQPPNRAMSRGRRYEALILDDFAAGHPEFVLGSAGLCRNVDRPWQICTPDALAHESEAVSPDTDLEPVAVVEAKSGARRDQW
ncbi:MAG: YqaJ viral recombinase family protein, partial [Nocardioidaceae bacterium]